MNEKEKEVFAQLLDPQRSIAFRPGLARALGSATAALMISQAIYWQQKKGWEKWFFKIRDAERDDRGVMIEPGFKYEKWNKEKGELEEWVVRQSWEWETGMPRGEQSLREWSDEQIKQVFPRSTHTRCPHGAGASWRITTSTTSRASGAS